MPATQGLVLPMRCRPSCEETALQPADAKLKEADEAIKKAHNAQTDVIQDECRGNPTELSLLFMHAQDTVMTIISEVSMIRLMIQMNRNLEDKINGNRN